MTRRRVALVSAVLVPLLLLAAYAAIGTWWLPRILERTLVDRASQLGLQIRVERIRTDPFRLRLDVEGLTVSTAARPAATLAAVPHGVAELAWRSLRERAWVLQRVQLERPKLDAARLGEARLPQPTGDDPPPVVVQELRLDDGTVALGDGLPPLSAVAFALHDVSTRGAGDARVDARATYGDGRIEADARLRRQDGGWSLADVRLAAHDLRHDRFAVRELELRTAEIPLPPHTPIALQADARLDGDARVQVDGRLGLQPLQLDAALKAQAVPLARIAAMLPSKPPVDVESGTLSADGRLRLAVAPDQRPPAVRYTGRAMLDRLRVVEHESRELLAALRHLDAGDVELDVPGHSLRAGTVRIQAPEARLAIGPQGDVNWSRVFRPKRDAQPGTPPPRPATPGSDASPSANEQSAFRWSIARLKLDDGTLHLADRSLDTPFDTTIAGLSGTVEPLARPSQQPAKVQLDGRVAERGAASIHGTIDLDRPRQLADLTARLRDVPLPAFSPYAARFAGYRIRAGQVSAQLHYEVRDGRLQGRNDVVLQRLQLGEKVRERGLVDVPLDLAVALLSDANGRIDLDIPVTGNLNDPKVDLGGLFAKAVGNVLQKVVTAPFRALASLAGGRGGRDAAAGAGDSASGGDTVAFEPGSAQLAADARQRLDGVAKLLKQRPRLVLTVRGRFDASRDAEALRRLAVQREVARRAGVAEARGLAFDDDAVRQAAERLYLERAGSRLELQQLRSAGGDYRGALLARLMATVPATQADPAPLAVRRAESIVAALTASGIDRSRLRIERPTTSARASAGRDGGTDAALELGLA